MLAALSVTLTLLSQDPASALLEPVELRALVVDPAELDVLGDRDHLGTALDRLAEVGFDAVIPLAWKDGRALAVPSALAQAAPGVQALFPGRDVLAEIVFEAHRAGLEVLPAIDGAFAGLARRPAAAAELRALARGFATGLARAAEIDGLVLLDGLPALTPDEARGKDAAAITSELIAWREELRAFDRGLVVVWAALDPRWAGPADLGLLARNAVDFVLLREPPTDAQAPLAAWIAAGPRRAGLWLRVGDEAQPDAFLAQIAGARKAPLCGEALGPFAALARGEGALFDALSQGVEAPYYARATPPWRGTEVWRPRAEPIGSQIDAGGWVDEEDAAGWPVQALAAGEAGSLSWSWKPTVRGSHELYVHLPEQGDLPPKLRFTVPTDPKRARRVEVDTAASRGWVALGRVLLNEPRKAEVLRLDVPADAGGPARIGPVVAILRRRLEAR
jgi:hypothetical protein